MSHCSPAASTRQSSAPPGRILHARELRLSLSPTATRTTRPDAHMRWGSFVPWSKYFHRTSRCLPTIDASKAG
eukprot:CAMPEP_0182822350 /NCGR_PEP_ID=MMETSP0006_2-20121128/14166_1 /TAXON_ID=97485 /ORGANISM="Prymnesium parvum, Strain Texoma1" /LENGTH=72 /DNA_ID=CAMNT_0024949187 /DNA_START=78 /DNA_END=292 /DNA_ORIENTATION=-